MIRKVLLKFKAEEVNIYVSALSAYHDKVDNQAVGKRPQVFMMTGNHANPPNPPKPRYVFIWDVKQVLTIIREMPNNP